ncbi:MAG: PBSX family phage terminase large subunit [Candidatus Limiplasma sp.]|nr:PBSX family phage terminase large subunit [Candidatus Limiplasma sp.]
MVDVRLSQLMAPTFHPAHHAAKHRTHTEIWLHGGRGSGKSSFVSLEIILGMMRDPQANTVVYRKVADTLRESVYAQMMWAIDKLQVSAYWQPRLSPLEIIYKPTGQRILFRGADDPGKSKGLKLRQGFFKYLWFEELTEFHGMEDVRTIKASVIRGETATTFYTYNPPMSAGSWVNAEALVPRTDRLTHHSTYLDMPFGWLGKDFLAEAQALQETNERAYRHMYLGEVTGTGGQVFDNLELRAITAKEWQGLPLYCGHDFGFAVDPDAFVRCAFDRRRRILYIVDEFVAVGLGLDSLAREIKKRCGSDIITADSAEPRSIAELRGRGLRIIPAKKGPDSIAHGMRWLQTLGKIVIDKAQCPNAAKEFQGYEYDRDTEGRFLSRYPDKNNHTIDAVRYAMESVSTRRTAIAVS